MALQSEIKGYMTFGKSFSRSAAFPLDAYEVWTDYAELVAYAANTDPSQSPSYVGQKVVYVDYKNNKVVHYSIEIDGSLKELGGASVDTTELDNRIAALETAGYVTAEEVARNYATKEYVGSFTTGEDKYKDIATIVEYINRKAEETLAAAQGGSSETAASVALALQNYKSENDVRVQQNTAAIAILNGAVDVEGSVQHIVAIELAKIISDDDTDIDTLNEIAAWIVNDTTGAAKMANDIASLNTRVDIEGTISSYVASEIAKIGSYDLPLATQDSFGGVRLSDEIGTNEAGQLEVKTLSTDKLVNGSMELVLNGGNATGKA